MMEGIKEAIKYIAELAVEAENPKTVDILGKCYARESLIRCDEPDKAEPIKATTLSSLIDYIRECRDEMKDRHMLLHVVSPTKVQLFTELLEERDREILFEVNAMLPRFDYGQEYGQESFIVAMQACFKLTGDREAVTMCASNVVNTQQATYSDDGTSQQVTMMTGVAKKGSAIVPNPVNLKPYRTFAEVEQPESEFVFRIGANRDSTPNFKLVEADGGKWKLAAMENVRMWLIEMLEDEIGGDIREQITVIS